MILSGLSLSACGIVLAYLLARKEPLREVLSFVVVLLVASIPIAIEIVSTTTLALGSRSLSKQGAIVSKLTAIEEMAGMNMLCSDKTGTLTLNKMVIQGKSFFLFLQVVPFFRERRNVGFFLSHFFHFLVELKKKKKLLLLLLLQKRRLPHLDGGLRHEEDPPGRGHGRQVVGAPARRARHHDARSGRLGVPQTLQAPRLHAVRPAGQAHRGDD